MKNNQTVSLAGRVVLITGANTGIGLITARELAAQGAHVFIACRSRERGQEAINEIRSSTPNVNIELLVLDLGDLDSVRTCATTFLARDLPLHILINNAGLAGARGLSKSGFEMAFGVNHVGHFLFTQLLLDRIKQSAPARIVTVSSRAHTRVSGIDWNAVTKPTQTTTGFQEYGVSKLANLLFSAELGRKLVGTGVTTYALHPGVVASDVWRKVPWPFRTLMKLTMITVEEGAKTTIHCATSSDVANETGLYYDKRRVKEPTAVGQDAALAAELWRRSEAWVRA
jgi:retinol dehydrogenase 12